MKKLLLSFALMATMSATEISAQDFSSYCSTTRTTNLGITSGGKGAGTVTYMNGEFLATVDTVAFAQAEFTWSINEFWLGGTEISDSTFKLKVKSSFSGTFRISILNDGYNKTYDVPFLTNKALVGGNDYVEYSLTATGPQFNYKKFQQVLFRIIPATDVVAGKLSIKDFSYGKQGCAATAVNKSNALVSSINIFPNPALNNEATVEATLKSNAAVKFVVNNITGEEIYSSSVINTSSLSEKINTTGWPKGIYSVSVMTDVIPAKTSMLVIQ